MEKERSNENIYMSGETRTLFYELMERKGKGKSEIIKEALELLAKQEGEN